MPKSKTPTTNSQLPSTTQPKVAIVHDWLVGGGAELVVEQLHQLYPDAPIYTSYATKKWRKRLHGKVKTSLLLQRWPFNKLRKYLAIPRILWFRSLRLNKYDIVISSSGNGEAKHVLPHKVMLKKPIHINYCHTPVHYYWRHHKAYMKNPGFGFFNPLARLGLKVLISPLKKADYNAAQRVDFFIANSRQIKKDIRNFYDHDATLIHPPVNIKRFSRYSVKKKNRKGFVTVGRLVPNKRVDILVRACSELNQPLTVVGRGPELMNLKKLAGDCITFETDASDRQVEKHLRHAKAFLFASHEDFGIAPVEALASGTPVIAYRAGGALDYVKEGKTGIFFNTQSVKSLKKAITEFNNTSNNSSFNTSIIKKLSRDFSDNNFRKRIKKYVADIARKHTS